MKMKPIILADLDTESLLALEDLYHKTKTVRLRTRAQMVLLSAEQKLKVPQIAKIVRVGEVTVLRWLKRYKSEGLSGLSDAPRPGSPRKVTTEYKEELVRAVRRRPRAMDLPFSLWTLDRLADYMAEETGIRLTKEGVRLHLKAQGIVLSRPQHKISSPDPEYQVKKRRLRTKETT